jgi:hypothetical protein
MSNKRSKPKLKVDLSTEADASKLGGRHERAKSQIAF